MHTLSLEEVKAIVDEAHRAGRKVAAHVTNEASTRITAEAGADSIEHAYEISDDYLRKTGAKTVSVIGASMGAPPPPMMLRLRLRRVRLIG